MLSAKFPNSLSELWQQTRQKVTTEVGPNLQKWKSKSRKERSERYSSAWSRHSREQESFSWQDRSPREPELKRSMEHATSPRLPDPDRRRWHGCRVVLRRVTAGWVNCTSGTGAQKSLSDQEKTEVRAQALSREPPRRPEITRITCTATAVGREKKKHTETLKRFNFYWTWAAWLFKVKVRFTHYIVLCCSTLLMH